MRLQGDRRLQGFRPVEDCDGAATFLKNAGIPTFIDDKHAIAHSKVLIIDSTLITGSFNFTKAAEDRNAENMLVIKGSPDLVRQYEENIRVHLGHSQPYERQ